VIIEGIGGDGHGEEGMPLGGRRLT
jgi:hypothetical protein